MQRKENQDNYFPIPGGILTHQTVPSIYRKAYFRVICLSIEFPIRQFSSSFDSRSAFNVEASTSLLLEAVETRKMSANLGRKKENRLND